MWPRNQKSLETTKQLALRDDPENTVASGDRVASIITQTANAACNETSLLHMPVTHTALQATFNNIGTSRKVTNIAGHVIHGDFNVYTTGSTTGVSFRCICNITDDGNSMI